MYTIKNWCQFEYYCWSAICKLVVHSAINTQTGRLEELYCFRVGFYIKRGYFLKESFFIKFLAKVRKLLKIIIFSLLLVRKYMDVNEYERLSNVTLRHKLK
jgi:hypothetical protein